MLNYIGAELYKFTRKEGVFVGMAILLILESLVFVPGVMVERELEEEGLFYLAFFLAALPVGLFLAPIFAVRAFDDQYGAGTLKNETVYGIPRARSYLGKLLTGMTVGTICALIAVGWFFLLTALSTRRFPVTAEQWGGALTCVGICWLSWLSVLSLTFFLLTALKSSAGALTIVYLLTLIGLPMAVIGGSEASSPHWFAVLCRLFYTYPYGGDILINGIKYSGPNSTLLYALGVSALWVGGATALGLVLFHRREIK